MIREMTNSTARLAMIFGASLLAAEGGPNAAARLNLTTARELAVMARVLENRLRKTRETIRAALFSSEAIMDAGREVPSGVEADLCLRV